MIAVAILTISDMGGTGVAGFLFATAGVIIKISLPTWGEGRLTVHQSTASTMMEIMSREIADGQRQNSKLAIEAYRA